MKKRNIFIRYFVVTLLALAIAIDLKPAHPIIDD